MTTFADELRQAATNEAAAIDVDSFKKILEAVAAAGNREYRLAEFYYFRHETLGTAMDVNDEDDEGVWLEGPIEEICAALKAEGVEIFLTREFRYANHHKASGVVTIVNARW